MLQERLRKQIIFAGNIAIPNKVGILFIKKKGEWILNTSLGESVLRRAYSSSDKQTTKQIISVLLAKVRQIDQGMDQDKRGFVMEQNVQNTQNRPRYIWELI